MTQVGWQTKRLGDVLVKTETINPTLLPDDEFEYIDVSSVSNETFSVEATQRLRGRDAPSRARRLVLAGDVLLATIRPTLQRIAIVPPHLDRQVCSTGYFVLRPGKEIDHRFLFYSLFTERFMAAMRTLQKGASYPAVTDGEVRAQSITFPSRAKQRRIVAILDEAFEGIATAKGNAEKNLRNARELFESALDAALSQHDGGYVETTLGDEIDLLAGYAFSSEGYTDAVDGIRLLRGDNIMQGYLRWDSAKAWPANDVDRYARFGLQAGDVVLAMDRPWVKAGLKRAQIGAGDLPCLQLQRTARLRPRQRMRMEFLYHLTGSRSFSAHLLGVQTGLGVPHISGRQIESFRFMLPPPNEQRTIAGTLGELQGHSERLQEICIQKALALEGLKKSLLHQAFSGDL